MKKLLFIILFALMIAPGCSIFKGGCDCPKFGQGSENNPELSAKSNINDSALQ